jgi:photosystem II PsbY protein
MAVSQRTVKAQAASTDSAQTLGKLALLSTAATTFMASGNAQAAQELGQIAAGSDNRLGLLAVLFVPAIGWVAFNILGPALNQYQNMRLKNVAAGLGLGAASLLLAQQADAANQVAELAASDNRLLILATIFVPAVGWVAFNILGPALNQLKNMGDQNAAPTKGGRRR